MLEKLLLTISVLLLLAFITCGCIQDYVTPAFIEPVAIEYNDGYDQMNPLYTSLFDAKRIQNQINQKYKLNQKELRDALAYDSLCYSYIKDAIELGIINAEELKNNIFDPSNGLGFLLAGAPAFALGWLGLSKPSDKKKLNGNGTK